jgi:chloride channel protein, CIC family
MKFSGSATLNKEFDFRLAGRWLILGSIVGVISGLGAILFQSLLLIVKEFTIVHLMGLQAVKPGGESLLIEFPLGKFNPYLIVLLPAVGGLIAGFIIYTFAPEAEGHGTDEAIRAFHKKRGIIRPSVPIVKLIASVITIGTGGSGGREGPIAQIGAGFGSFLATRLNMNTRTRRWLLAAGMGAGIGSIFRAPLAGAIFAAEVLYSSAEVETEVLLPATVSSIIAYSIYSFGFGWEHIFTNAGQHGFSNPLELIPYTIEALVLAFAAFAFVKSFYGIRNVFQKMKIPNFVKPMIGGLLTGALALLLIFISGDKTYIIDVMGGGYGILQDIFENGIGKIGLGVLLLVSFGKILTTSFTISSGGSAGVFGPSMVIGGTLGAAAGYIFQFLFPGLTINPSTYAIVGMAGFFAAAANTPLSTIIMVSELTGNYELLMPSMWVCSMSYLVARRWSIYQSQVSSKLYSQAHYGEYARDVFETISVDEAFNRTRRFMTIPVTMAVEDILTIIRNTRQRIFPVLDDAKNILGAFSMSDVTDMLQEKGDSIKSADQLMHKGVLRIHPSDTIDIAQRMMLTNHVDELLVIDELEKPAKILGIITTADIMMAYNRKLSQIKFGRDIPEALPEDKTVLQNISVHNVLEKDILTLEPDASLGQLVKAIIQSKRNIFPVVDHDRNYFGTILLNDVREIMFDQEKYETVTVKDLMTKPPALVKIDDPMNRVMEKFEKTQAWNLPVIDKHNHYLGMVSKSSIFSAYRNQLLSQAEI